MVGLAPLTVLLPLAGALINMFFGRALGRERSGTVAVVAAALAFGVSVGLAGALVGNGGQAVIVPLAEWISIGSFSVDWAFQVDTLSVTMMLVVTGVGTLIHIYATGYMREDVAHHGDSGRYTRFFVYLNLFLAAMLTLVGADNYLMMFVGWEGVGLCSFLLIGFWFEKGEAGTGNAKAAMKAFIVNRVGDFGLMVAMFMIFWSAGSLTYGPVFEWFEANQAAAATVVGAITLCLLLGAAGKSAQVPLYVWLPDAMAGPTPVSALIHAATMVTAGIYLIARSHVLFEMAPLSSDVVMWIGTITAIGAATIALAQSDIKRVLAYSTISQLGFMIAAVGMGAYVAGMFHLVTHAFFKALLFLASGSVIQAVERGMHHVHDHHTDPQDMRNMGGLWGKLPVTQWTYLIGALALAGIPPLAGFWSKDEILLDAYLHHPEVYTILSIAAVLTAFYMGRQLVMVFGGQARTKAAGHASESPLVMTLPLGILAVLSVVGGFINLPKFSDVPYVGELLFKNWLLASVPAEAVKFSWLVASLSTALALLSLFTAVFLYASAYDDARDKDPLAQMFGRLFSWMRDKWYIDELYQVLIIRPYLQLSKLIGRGLDTGGIDLSVTSLGGLVRELAVGFSGFQRGLVRGYAIVMFTGAVLLLVWFYGGPGLFVQLARAFGM